LTIAIVLDKIKMVIIMEKTAKKYYESAYVKDFAAVVMACEKSGENWRILLDGTCFYPGGGGQPRDTGMLGGMRVVECYAKDGLIWHIAEGDTPEFGFGDGIFGQVDFERRFAFMQNHTGEHVLSGLAKSGWGAANVGFHMSERGFTMDLDRPLDGADIERLEGLANMAVLEGVNVEISTVRGEYLAGLDVRSKKDFDMLDEVRLVDIGGYDLCACAGLHLRNTLEVGLVKIVAAQKYKGGVRLNVYCGYDALWDYTRKNDYLREISRLTSAKTQMCVKAVEKLLDVNAALKKDMGGLRNRIFEMRAAQVPENSPLAWFYEDGLDMEDMRRFADLAAKRAKLAVILSGQRYFICGRDDADSLRDFVHKFNEELGGRGGVNNLVAQGAVTADLARIEEFLRSC
jgi:alanyl-tRNA synthetase